MKKLLLAGLLAAGLFGQTTTTTTTTATAPPMLVPTRERAVCPLPGTGQAAIEVSLPGHITPTCVLLGPGVSIIPPGTAGGNYILSVVQSSAGGIFFGPVLTLDAASAASNAFKIPGGSSCVVYKNGVVKLQTMDFQVAGGILTFFTGPNYVPLQAGDALQFVCF